MARRQVPPTVSLSAAGAADLRLKTYSEMLEDYAEWVCPGGPHDMTTQT